MSSLLCYLLFINLINTKYPLYSRYHAGYKGKWDRQSLSSQGFQSNVEGSLLSKQLQFEKSCLQNNI